MAAQAAKGTTLAMRVSTDVPSNYTTIGQVESIDGPGISHPTIDVSDLEDTNRQKISSGLYEGGQVSISVFLDPQVTTNSGTHDDLFDMITGGETANFKITWPAASTVKFPAAVVGGTPSASSGEALKGTIELDVTGAVTFTT